MDAPGLHHVTNATTAMLAVDVLRQGGLEISERAVEVGFRRAVWPGRFQLVRRRPPVILDAAHNVSGARMLVRSLKALHLRDLVTVFGVLRDKDFGAMLSLLSGYSEKLVLTKPDSERALPLVKLREAARSLGLGFKATSSVEKAVRMAIDAAGSDRPVLVCGSLYALGEAMEALHYRPYRVKVC